MKARAIQLGAPPTTSRIAVDDDGAPAYALGVDSRVVLCLGDKPPASFDGLPSPASALALDRTVRRLAAGCDGGSLRLWDVATGEPIRGLSTGHRVTVTSIDYHPFGDFMMTASRDTHVRVWDLRKKSNLQVYKQKDGGIPASIEVVRMAPDGIMAASGCANGKIRLYDLRNGKPTQTLDFHGGPITSIAFHPTRCAVAAACAEGSVSVWDLETYTLMFSAKATDCRKVAFAENTLIGASSRALRRWDVPQYNEMPVREMPLGDVDDFITAGQQVHGSSLVGAAAKVFTADVRVKKGGGVSAPLQPSKAAQGRVAVPQPGSRPIQSATSPQAAQTPSFAVHGPRDQPPSAAHEMPKSLEDLGPSNRSRPDFAQQYHQQQQQPQQRQMISPRKTAAVLRQAAQDAPQPAPQQQPVPAPRKEPADDGLDLDEAIKRSDTMTALMQRRVTQVKVLRNLWHADVAKAMVHAEQLTRDTTDCGAVVDLFNAIVREERVRSRITLETLGAVLVVVSSLMQKHAQSSSAYMLACLKTARVLNGKFRSRIDETLRGAAIASGVDLSMESRIEKCRSAQRAFDTIQDRLGAFLASENDVGEEARGLTKELPPVRR